LDRTTNILSSRWTRLTVRVVPLGYLSWIEVDIGFRNPRLVLQGGQVGGTGGIAAGFAGFAGSQGRIEGMAGRIA
jgi:hypothetical protein